MSSLESLRAPQGLDTGVHVIDDFLYWRGLPQGDLVLFHGQPGSGAARLWMQTSRRLEVFHQKSAWVSLNSGSPSALKNQNISHFLVFAENEVSENLFTALSELIVSQTFALIGCSVGYSSICLQHLQQLKVLCQKTGVTLVFISQSMHFQMQPVFPLVIDCQEDFYTIHKASHRPTPMVISGNMINFIEGPADFMSH